MERLWDHHSTPDIDIGKLLFSYYILQIWRHNFLVKPIVNTVVRLVALLV